MRDVKTNVLDIGNAVGGPPVPYESYRQTAGLLSGQQMS
jgi:hypothetical protein